MDRRGHGEGTIYRRKDGRWSAQITIQSGRRKTLYGKTKTEVRRKLLDAQIALRQGHLSAEPTQHLSDYLAAWLEMKRSAVRPRTFDSYSLNVRRVTPTLGTVRLDLLRPAHLQECYRGLLASGLSPRSVQQTHVVIHGALEDALRLDLVPRNVGAAVTPPHVPRREMTTLSLPQLRTLFEASRNDRFHALWVLLGTTGMRLGEALGLQWDDVSIGTGTLRVQRALQRQRNGLGLKLVEPKSAASRRPIHVGTLTRDALLWRRQQQERECEEAGEAWQDTGLIFTTAFGTPLDQGRVHRHWTAILSGAGLPRLRIHDLRHTVATLLLEQDVHPRVVQELLGHSSIALTLGTYSHVAPAMHREAALRIDALLGGQIPAERDSPRSA